MRINNKINNNAFLRNYEKDPEKTLKKYNKVAHFLGYKCNIIDIEYSWGDVVYNININGVDYNVKNIFNKEIILTDEEFDQYDIQDDMERVLKIKLTRNQFISCFDVLIENFIPGHIIKIYEDILSEDDKIMLLDKLIKSNNKNNVNSVFEYNKFSINMLERYIKYLFTNKIYINTICKCQDLNDKFILNYIKKFNNSQLELILENQKNIKKELRTKLEILLKLK